ncbi:MAG: PIN domain-containing protein [Desulfobacterales bacterium]
MNTAQYLSGVRSVFLDTAPVIYYVEAHPLYLPKVEEIFEYIDNSSLVAVTSPITLSECLILPYRLKSEELEEKFSALIVRGGNTLFMPIDDITAKQAAKIRVKYNLSLADALQVAVALAAECDAFLTNDIALKRVQELKILVIDEITA